MKALIIEDNFAFAESLKKTLAPHFFEIRIKPSWSSATSLIDTDLFDMIILDILLPDIKGFDVLKILSEKNIKSKIILISGLFDKKTVFEKIPNDIKKNCHFLKKPINEKTLIEYLEKEFHKTYETPFINSLF
ncbi:MAG: response regulator, partial [Bdellovibrionaceae bacterium]|nr:response regulator [Pseudobdellovibrionaceae bacterium]